MAKSSIHRRGRRGRHGHTDSPTYRTWDHMIQRCTNPKNDEYPNYGARGIGISERWFNFENFLADMGPRPQGMTIDRVDNNKGYGPSNCRWASPRQQSNNKRTNRLITFEGQTGTYSQWCRWRGWPRHTVGNRIYAGWDPIRAITTPVQQYRPRQKYKALNEANPSVKQ